MANSLIITLLCFAILVGNIVWGFITDDNFPYSMRRAFLMVLGALMAYFVIL